MISAQNLKGNMISKKLRELTDEDIKKVSDLYNKHSNNEEVNVPGFAKTVTEEELENNDYSFVPGRYVETVKEEIDEEKTKEEIKNLSYQLENLFSEFEKLIPEVKTAIKKACDFNKK
jgi:type I restriction enzyme M protein